MKYIDTTASEFLQVVDHLSTLPCLYSKISKYDWHLRLCFLGTYEEVTRKGNVIIRGEIEVLTEVAYWSLFDEHMNLIASSKVQGYGDVNKDYFAGRNWSFDMSHLPILTSRSAPLLLKVEPCENMASYACWSVMKEDVSYDVYEDTVELSTTNPDK